jgi:hypothetical protein
VPKLNQIPWRVKNKKTENQRMNKKTKIILIAAIMGTIFGLFNMLGLMFLDCRIFHYKTYWSDFLTHFDRSELLILPARMTSIVICFLEERGVQLANLAWPGRIIFTLFSNILFGIIYCEIIIFPLSVAVALIRKIFVKS